MSKSSPLSGRDGGIFLSHSVLKCITAVSQTHTALWSGDPELWRYVWHVTVQPLHFNLRGYQWQKCSTPIQDDRGYQQATGSSLLHTQKGHDKGEEHAHWIGYLIRQSWRAMLILSPCSLEGHRQLWDILMIGSHRGLCTVRCSSQSYTARTEPVGKPPWKLTESHRRYLQFVIAIK